MSSLKLVPCPDGGRCGTQTHHSGSAQFWDCSQRATRSKVASSSGFGSPVIPERTGPERSWLDFRYGHPTVVSVITGLERASDDALDALDRYASTVYSGSGRVSDSYGETLDRLDYAMAADSQVQEDAHYGSDVQEEAAGDLRGGSFVDSPGMRVANDALLAVAARSAGVRISDDDYVTLTRGWKEAGLYLPGSTSADPKEQRAIDALDLDDRLTSPKAVEEFESIWNGASADGYSRDYVFAEAASLSERLAQAGSPENPMTAWEAESIREQQLALKKAIETRGRSMGGNQSAVEELIAGA